MGPPCRRPQTRTRPSWPLRARSTAVPQKGGRSELAAAAWSLAPSWNSGVSAIFSLTHIPMAIRIALARNGMRQPQAMNWLSDRIRAHQQKDRGRDDIPQCSPNRRHHPEAAVPAFGSIFDGKQRRSGPLAAKAEPLSEPRKAKEDRRDPSRSRVGRKEGDREGTAAHQQQRRDQCGLASDSGHRNARTQPRRWAER